MSEKLFLDDFKFGGHIVYIPYSRKNYAAYHVDNIKENDTAEAIKKRGTFMSYISVHAVEHNKK